jgi:hypothetical protein
MWSAHPGQQGGEQERTIGKRAGGGGGKKVDSCRYVFAQKWGCEDSPALYCMSLFTLDLVSDLDRRHFGFTSKAEWQNKQLAIAFEPQVKHLCLRLNELGLYIHIFHKYTETDICT